MAEGNNNLAEGPPAAASVTAEEAATRAVSKRYEGLVMVRTKAVKGKGAWYWAHLEPMLVHNPDTGAPKAVKLKCALCSALFSASNPSRTASEHLKRGTCPNFSSGPNPGPINPNPMSPTPSPKPISSMPPLTSPSSSHSNRKRNSSGHRAASTTGVGSKLPLAIIDPEKFSVELPVGGGSAAVSGSSGYFSVQHHQQEHHQQHHHHQEQHQQQHLILSGGKEDLGALAMLEDSVKKLKSPKSSPGQPLSKDRVDLALNFLSDWVYELGGSIPLSSLEHPKFRSFMNQVGLPAVTRRDFTGVRLDTKYDVAKSESEARIRDALFFQISSDGWKSKGYGEENLVNLSINLPNGTSVFRRVVFTIGAAFSLYAEEVLRETIRDICGNSVQQCVSIVSDKFKAKALRNLEVQNPWMVNFSCQFQGFVSLIKDFNRELPLFKNVTQNCLKLANFVNNKPEIWNSFRKYQVHEYGQSMFLRVPTKPYEKSNFGPFNTLIEDILNSARALQLVLMDESFKILSMEEQIGREIEEMMRDHHFWNELEAVHSLVKLIKSMAREIEKERPLVGQCIPLWDELRSKIKDWCARFHINKTHVERITDRRFSKNYHPAWSAAFILDPLYLIRDTSGKYIPPFKCLTPEQEKDVDKLITRLVSREEAHIALMELMKWRTEGLEPVYAQAVQLKQKDPISGKMKLANPQSSRLVWETHLTQFKSLGKVAVRLIFLHATSCGFKSNKSFIRWMSSSYGSSRVGIERAQKLIFIAAHSKLEKRELWTDEEREAELFTLANGEDDVQHEVFC